MTTTNEIPAGALYIEPAERITRPNDGETTETRLGRLEREVAALRAAMERHAHHVQTPYVTGPAVYHDEQDG